jgi:dipeptidase D
MILSYFKQLTKISRCSGDHKPFIEYISNFAHSRNYIVEIDEVNNILCKKSNNSKLCLQSHYDIVCINNNSIDILEQDGFYSAKNSTLGADNGVGCAIMMSIMDSGLDVELLFSADEEIGLIGASGIDLQLNAKYMLNLDTEEYGEVYIGCAGGVDIKATKKLKLIPSNQKYHYRLSLSGLSGGHSGVDIDKNIPNAFKEAIKLLPFDAKIGYIAGGQRINSIPTSVVVEFSSNTIIEDTNIESIDKIDVFDSDIIDVLEQFDNGVIEYNKEINIVHTSQNLAIITTKETEIIIEVSIRSMDNNDLNNQQVKNKNFFNSYGFDIYCHDKYPSWKPDINEFALKVQEIYKEFNKDVGFKAIHAGLECAVFASKYPEILITSIGPNIYNPHSNNERVEIDSILRVDKIVNKIIELI